MAFRNPDRVSLRECQHRFTLLTDHNEYLEIVRKREVKQSVIFDARFMYVHSI